MKETKEKKKGQKEPKKECALQGLAPWEEFYCIAFGGARHIDCCTARLQSHTGVLEYRIYRGMSRVGGWLSVLFLGGEWAGLFQYTNNEIMTQYRAPEIYNEALNRSTIHVFLYTL